MNDVSGGLADPDVMASRLAADEQRLGDLRVSQALGEQAKDLPLPPRQVEAGRQRGQGTGSGAAIWSASPVCGSWARALRR